MFGGNSTSTTQNTTNVTQPTTTVTGGTGANAVSTTGAVTFNQESPQALNSLDNALQVTGAVALQALQSNSETAKSTEALVGKNTETSTQQWAPVVLGLAAVTALFLFFARRKT